MKKIIIVSVVLMVVFTCVAAAGGNQEKIVGRSADGGPRITVEIEEGSSYLHRLKILPLIRVKSPPQLAVWLETESGEFLETLYVTSRAGTNSWRSAPLDSTPAEEIARPEALPVWSHRAGRMGETREETETDAVSSATPKSSYSVKSDLPEQLHGVRVLLEVNHSTDFNEAYPEDASPAAGNYSGGPWGSGQPSLIYGASLKTEVDAGPVDLELLGHGSLAGEDGEVYRNLEGLSTALQILKNVHVRIDG